MIRNLLEFLRELWNWAAHSTCCDAEERAELQAW